MNIGEYREIIIPGDLVADENVSDGAKILYGKIARLTWKDGYCWASNRFLDGTETGRSASRHIAELRTNGYIRVETVNHARQITLSPLNSKVIPAKNSDPPCQTGDPPRQEGQPPSPAAATTLATAGENPSPAAATEHPNKHPKETSKEKQRKKTSKKKRGEINFCEFISPSRGGSAAPDAGDDSNPEKLENNPDSLSTGYDSLPAENGPLPPDDKPIEKREDAITIWNKARDFWNELNLKPQCRFLMMRGTNRDEILRTFQHYSWKEIKDAIDNYDWHTKAGPEYNPPPEYGSLEGFLKTGVEKYYDSDAVDRLFRKKGK
jgi:hypothetical protein